MKQYTRVLARVNLDAVEYNIEMMKKNIHKNTQMMAVIKMDGYCLLYTSDAADE